MSSHSENARTTVEYRGSRIECSDAVSAECLKAILLEDKKTVANLIAAKGANLNETYVKSRCHSDSRRESYTATALTLAAKFASCNFIRRMLKRGADPNVKCDLTPLGVAVSMNNERLVALLVDSGADVNVKSRDTEDESRGLMQTPLHIACSKGFLTTAIYLLLKGALPDDDDEIENWLADSVEKYSEWKGRETFPTKTIHPDRLYQLECEFHEFSHSILDGSKNTPLHYACADGDKDLTKQILDEDATIIDAQNIEKQSPVNVALNFGQLKIVFMLIERGCSLPQPMLSATNSRGNTLLHIACTAAAEKLVGNRYRVAANKLIEAGSSLSVTNKNGKSAMHYAWRNGELRNTVLDHVFQCSLFDDMFAPPLRPTRVRALRPNGRMHCLRHGFPRENNDDDPTADELALYKTLCTVVSEVPLRSFAVTNEYLCSSCGKLTPKACYLLQRRGMLDDALLLSVCCGTSYANKQIALQLHRVEMTQSSESDLKLCIEEWIQKGANINAAGCTPLHLAYRDGASEDVINMLLDFGANPYIVNKEGMTPLDYAVDKLRGKLLLSTVNSEGKASTKLLMLARAGVLSQQLAYLLACGGARINPKGPSSCDFHLPTYYLSGLLDILAGKNMWGVVCELVRMGCCDYTDDMFKSMFQISLRDTTNFYNKVRMWKWFSLAGFWQNKDFIAQFERFLVVEFHRWQPERDTHTDVNAATATSELAWLKDDVRNPPSLHRQCVYTIRCQLILADTTGRTIFPSIEKLPLPTRLKDSLKLEASEASAECFVAARDMHVLASYRLDDNFVNNISQ